MPRRSLLGMFLLTIFTFGIYQIYWIYKTRQELAAAKQNLLPFRVLMAPFIALIAVALLQFVAKLIFRTDGNQNFITLGVNIFSIIIGMVAVLAIIPVTIFWFYYYCKSIESVTAEKLSFELSFIMFIVFGFVGVSIIWPFIVQSHFNRFTKYPHPKK